MRWFLRAHWWLPIVLGPGCVDMQSADVLPAGEIEPAGQPGQAFAGACQDYSLGEQPENDAACFVWAAVRCAVETDADVCEATAGVASPSGDLQCAWAGEATVVDPEEECRVLEASARCVAAVDLDRECEGTSRWINFSEQAGEAIVVEVDCAVQPVPDFDPCDVCC
jgi:hypothetical protein